MINILIVDDSKTETALLRSMFEAEADLRVTGTATNGKEALNLVKTLKPDLITMDIAMPIMDGLEATRLILSQYPVPIVVISSRVDDEYLNATFSAMEAGALSVLEKPVEPNSPGFNKQRKKIIETVRSMAEIRVIKRRFNTNQHEKTIQQKLPLLLPTKKERYEIIAIGASVGGPQALKKILSALPSNFPVPIVIVQHMTNGFITGFTHWLDKNTHLHIRQAEHNEPLRAGHVYFAPDHFHLQIDRDAESLVAKLIKGQLVSGFCPSATVLLKSVAETCGKNAIGVLLTGMGNDGAEGLLALKQTNAHTVIQDPESAIVFGMAGVAQSIGAVEKVVNLDEMAEYLVDIVGVKEKL